MWLLVCSEGVEYLRTRKTGDQLYSEPSHNHNQRFLACLQLVMLALAHLDSGDFFSITFCSQRQTKTKASQVDTSELPREKFPHGEMFQNLGQTLINVFLLTGSSNFLLGNQIDQFSLPKIETFLKYYFCRNTFQYIIARANDVLSSIL